MEALKTSEALNRCNVISLVIVLANSPGVVPAIGVAPPSAVADCGQRGPCDKT
jgi:hypothetical protein